MYGSVISQAAIMAKIMAAWHGGGVIAKSVMAAAYRLTQAAMKAYGGVQ